MIPRIAITTGEPAGVGPQLCATLSDTEPGAELVLIGDPELLHARAAVLGRALSLEAYDRHTPPVAGRVCIAPVPLRRPAICGELDPGNARYVLATLDRAIEGCMDGEFQAMVTAPVHKGVINSAGIAFTGHTEYLAESAASEQVVMMLAAPGLRVALATTHLPLAEVAGALRTDDLMAILRCVHEELATRFAIRAPRILVAGLNPHAGEGGYLGREEIDIIEPVVRRLRAEGLDLTGPLPADTLFTPPWLARADAVLAMYHDQGLPVLKHLGFGQAVNITLGLPFVRTSVDHGTALDLAGCAGADPGSLRAALRCALDMCA